MKQPRYRKYRKEIMEMILEANAGETVAYTSEEYDERLRELETRLSGKPISSDELMQQIQKAIDKNL